MTDFGYGPGYHKIETFFNRDNKTHKICTGDVRVPEFLAVDRWLVEEKMDGQNIRIHLVRVGDEPPVASFNGRTDKAQLSGPVREMVGALALRAAGTLLCPELYHDQVVLYGEAIGPKINGNPHRLTEPQFVLFDVLRAEIGGPQKWAERDEVRLWAAKLGVQMPPICTTTSSTLDIIDLVRAGFPSQVGPPPGTGDFPLPQAEGVICRPKYELTTQAGARIIWKLKTKDF